MDSIDDEPFNADARRAQALERAKQLRREFENDLRSVMNAPQGRRLIWQLIARSGMWESSFAEGEKDMIFREGGRNQGLRLYSDLQKICPELLLRMHEEHKYAD